MVAVLFAHANTGLDPLNFTGPYFLGFYAELLVLAVVGAAFWRRRLRKPDDEPADESLQLHPYEVAYLAGGEQLATNAALATLIHQDRLAVDAARRKVEARGSLEASAHLLERLIHGRGLEGGEAISKVRADAARHLRPVRDRLRGLGLLVAPGQAARVRLLPVLPLLGLLGLGLTKVAVGVGRGKPVALLVILCGVTLVAVLVTFAWPVCRSRRGDRALKRLKQEYAALRYAARHETASLAGADVALAVGLFGLTAFSGGPMASLQTALTPPASSGGCGGGGGGGCGGGGCGGGGCGGCGG